MKHNYVDNLIVYPRAYNRSPTNRDLSECIGLDSSGREVRVRVLLSDTDKEKIAVNPKRVAPLIDQIAKGNPKRAGCIATVDNGPDSPTGGILLFESVAKSPDGVYNARWASVLKHNASEKEPTYGVGYIEMYGVTSRERGDAVEEGQRIRVAIDAEMTKMRQALSAGDGTRAAAHRNAVGTLLGDYDNCVNYRFRTVLVHADKAEQANFKNLSQLRNRMIMTIDNFSHSGHLGGLIMRCKDKESGAILYNLSGQAHTRYLLTTRQYSSPVDEVDSFLRHQSGGALLSLDYSKVDVDLIPVSRISYPHNACQENNTPEKLEEIRTAFRNPIDLSPVVRPLVVRTSDAKPSAGAKATDTVSEMALRTLPIGAALGHPLLLDRNFDASLRFSHEPPPVVKTALRRLEDGQRYVVRTSAGDLATATCKKLPDSNSNRLFIGRKEIEDFTLIGLAPDANLSPAR